MRCLAIFYSFRFCMHGFVLVNHLIVPNAKKCKDPHHNKIHNAKEKDANFILTISLHLTVLGCLQFHPYDQNPICLAVYNVPILWEPKRVTQFNQYSSDCDGESLLKPLCDYGSRECFSADRICTFERDIYGDPVHCSDTEHLRYCASHQCPDAYKCDGSYCIPVHMVCDEILDCPDGEDETGCDDLGVEGLFRYGYIY